MLTYVKSIKNKLVGNTHACMYENLVWHVRMYANLHVRLLNNTYTYVRLLYSINMLPSNLSWYHLRYTMVPCWHCINYAGNTHSFCNYIYALHSYKFIAIYNHT